MNMFKPTTAKTPEEYLSLIAEPRKTEIQKVFDFVQKIVPGEKPVIMSGMIGWIPYHYKSKSGREGEWCVILLASQKNYISLYACGVVKGEYVAEKYKKQLPKADIGKSCIRFKKLEDLDLDVLKKAILEAKNHPMSIG